MRQFLVFILLALGGLVTPAQAQNRAGATLYTRTEGREVRVAVTFAIESGWKLYHTDLGDPNAIAVPLTAEFSGADGEWSALEVLDPHTQFVSDEYLGDYSVDYHSGSAIGFAHGTLAEGAKAADLELLLVGQTCDPSVCMPYEESITSKGEGDDAIWAKYPSETASSETEGEHAEEPTEDFDWEPAFGFGSSADGRLKLISDGTHVRVVIEIVTKDGWHLFDGPTSADMGPNEPVGEPTVFEFVEAGPVEWGTPVYPTSHDYDGYDKDFNEIQVQVLEGNLVFTIDGTLEPGADPEDLLDLVINVVGQTCDAATCVPYEQELSFDGDEIAMLDALPVLASVSSEASLAVGNQEGSTPSAGESTGADQGASEGASATALPEEEDASLLNFLLLAIMWGFITLLMPCTYPMIPITISFFTKQADQREGSVLPLSLAYGGGIVGIFVFIGVVVGPAIQDFANHPLFNLFVALMFIFFAFTLFGWINLQPPAFLMSAAGKASSTGGLAGVFLMGLTLVITSFTCTAPFVGSLLASGAQHGAMHTALGMGVFGLTMATPFVLLSLFPSRLKSMPNAGAWMNTLKVFLGFVELAASLKFLSTADLGWEWGFISKEVFLLVWGSIFLVAAAFLFGWINLKGEEDGAISPGRMVGATASFVFGMYSIFLIGGYRMDPLMLAFAPPYSTAPERAVSDGSAAKTHTIVKDDYEDAVSQAKAKKKALLVNFTGFN